MTRFRRLIPYRTTLVAALVALGVVAFGVPAWAQFETRGSFPSGEFPESIAVGDFNKDGRLDIAIASYLRNSQVIVLLGNGDGTFQPAVNYAVAGPPYSVATADFNRDGNPDLAVVAGSGISVLLGNGDGTFQPARNFATTAVPGFVATGDLNGDHIPDLVVADSPYVSVLLGNGDGTFQSPIDNKSLPTHIPALAVGDFNRDGDLDVAALAPNTGFTAVGILLGNGDGSFRYAASYTVGQGASSVMAADFRGDGRLDLAVSDSGAELGVLLGNGDGTFQTIMEYPCPTRSGPLRWILMAMASSI